MHLFFWVRTVVMGPLQEEWSSPTVKLPKNFGAASNYRAAWNDALQKRPSRNKPPQRNASLLPQRHQHARPFDSRPYLLRDVVMG